MKRLSLFSALIVLVSVANAGNVLVVSPTLPGAFTEIQAAVSAAQDGDLLLVKSGTYGPVDIDDKALAIVEDSGSDAHVVGGVRVANLASARSVVLSGLRVNGEVPGSIDGLVIANDAGSVRAIGCSFEGRFTPSGVGLPVCIVSMGARASSGLDVAFIECTLTGGRGQSDGGHGLYVVSSNVALYDCTLAGAQGASSDWFCTGYGDGDTGGFGLSCEDVFASAPSTIIAVRSTAQGGQGGYGGHTGTFGGNGGSGFATWCSSILFRRLECSFTGGAAGLGPGGNGFPGAALEWCPGTLPRAFPGLARRLTATRVVRENGVATLQYDGQPGDQVELRVTYDTGFTLVEGLRGVKLTRQPKPDLVLPVGTIGASGTLSVNWPLADLGAGVQSRIVFLQAVFTDTNGQSTLSSPAIVSVLDQSF